MSARAYIKDPEAIYRESFARIEAEAELRALPEELRAIASRMIHACGMVDIAADLAWSRDVVAAGRIALRARRPILCDVRMLAEGLIKSRFAGNEIHCVIAEERVAERAKDLRLTRAAAAIDFWLDRLEGAIVAIGNAPTALFRLIEAIEEGAPLPAVIIATPVGFVGAAESKAALIEANLGAPYLTLKGRRGGAAIAAAALNALAGEGT